MRSIWWTALAAAAVLVLQLVLACPLRSTANRTVLVGGAALAIVICAVLLVTGHQPQRVRSPKHESFESLLLRDRATAASPATRPGGPSPVPLP